jgi:soluble cytochrome b562
MIKKEKEIMSNAFDYAHLPAHLQEVSKPVGELAKLMKEALPDSAEKSAGLRKLLEAKDCFVRAKLGVKL